MSEAPRGFRSAESKSRVFRAVLRVGITGALLQLIVPMVLTLVSKPGLDLLAVHSIDPDRGALWKRSLWLLETGIGGLTGRSSRVQLLRWSGAEDDDLEPMASFDGADPWLLPAADRLWIVSRNAVGWLGAGGLEMERVVPASPSISSPFLWRGRPALVGETTSGPALFSFENHAWTLADLLDLGALDGEVGAADIFLQEGGDGGEPWLFVRTATTLLVGRGLPAGGAVDLRDAMETAVEGPDVNGQWVSAIVRGEPLLVTSRAGGRPEIAGFGRRDGQWSRRFAIETGLPGSVGVYSDDRDPERLLVACQGFPGSLTVWEVTDDVVGRSTKLGENPLEAGWLSGWQLANYALSLLIPVLAVLLLAPVLARHKDPAIPLNDGATTLPAALLLRRGLAKAVDGAIALLPVGIAAPLLLGTAFDVEQTIGESLGDLGTWVGVAFGWSAACLLLFSMLEARTGRTPGKRLLGVRVVAASGGPVSVGRALLRNLVLLADGAFGFLVGIALVALTPRWQRLGDLAAKTLVVRG